MAKYTTLTELSAAFKSGELDNTYFLRIDKGGCDLSLQQSGPEEGENERWKRCRELFDREYDCPMQELLSLAGIPSQNA